MAKTFKQWKYMYVPVPGPVFIHCGKHFVRISFSDDQNDHTHHYFAKDVAIQGMTRILINILSKWQGNICRVVGDQATL